MTDALPLAEVARLGRAILSEEVHRCRMCRHQMYMSEVRKLVTCPLCHTPIRDQQAASSQAAAKAAAAAASATA